MISINTIKIHYWNAKKYAKKITFSLIKYKNLFFVSNSFTNKTMYIGYFLASLGAEHMVSLVYKPKIIS